MIGTYASAALIGAASLLLGRTILAASGRESWSWLEPAVGFGALVAVAGLLVRLPGGGMTATVGLLVLIALGLAGLRRPYRLDGAIAPGAAVALALVLALSIPFAISGRWGLLGVGLNNDLGLHLAWSEWLRSGFGPEPDSGYPLGPQGIAIALAAVPRIGLGQAFVGELFAISVLTGLTALGTLGGLSGVRRVLAATLVALPYLAAAYFAQAAFKETVEALFVLAFAIALPALWPPPAGRRARWLALAPPGALLAGIFFSYSFAGLAWPLAIAALWSLTLAPVRRALAPRSLLRLLARPASLAWVAGLAAAVAVLAFIGPFGFAGGFSHVAGSQTYGPVSPAEALGVWPAANYRLDAAGGAPLAGIAGAVGLAALAFGIVWWVRRRELAVPVALAACVLVYLVSLPFSGDYSQAKALMIGSPLAMLIASRALLSGPENGWRGSRTRQRAGRIGWVALAAAFLAGAAYSSFLVLREAPVGPAGHGGELRAFVPELRGQKVLFAGQDRFAAYELLGADTDVPLVEFPDPDVVQSPTKPFDTGDAYSPIDFDSFTSRTLNRHSFVVTGSAAWNSRVPRNFREASRTTSFILWRRVGKTPQDRQTLLEGTEPAAPVDCAAPETRIFVAGRARASIFPRPVIGPKDGWTGGTALKTGQSTAQTLELSAGRWRLSLQYFSPFGLTLRAPGFSRELVPALDGQRPNTISLSNDGQYWPAGEITTRRAGPVRFTLRAADPTTLQRLSGYDGEAQVGRLVAVAAGPHSTTPLARTCGQWLDYYEGGAP
ncbi:MAG: hypothetical protein ACXWZM_05695 [Solirubrobacterales bacterium]